MEPKEYQSFEHVSGYRSAIKERFSKQGQSMPEPLSIEISRFFRGYRRKIAQLKQDGKKSMQDGKKPLSFRGYRFLADLARNQERDHTQSIFALLFLLLAWNLIARCVSVSGIRQSHFGWNVDALTVTFPKHKGDEGMF